MKVTLENLIKASKLPSATQAAASLGIQYNTYRKYAKKAGVWNTNQSGKGIKKSKPVQIKTEDILEGKYPHYQRRGIKRRLFKENIKEERCEMCGLKEWRGVKIGLELDHINGNTYDHKIENLRILCPNCHATTDTYRGKNKASMA
jgi:HNH endonuclease